MTQAPSLVGLFIPPLNRGAIEYMVAGGLAAVVYGHPRLTLDVDLVIRLRQDGASAFAALWPPQEFYCPPADVIAAESARVEFGHFNVMHNASGMRADVYCAGADGLQAWALQRRVVRQIAGEAVQFAPIEYVIVYKLRYVHSGGSDRHLDDIARMLEVSGSTVNEPALHTWIDRLELGAEWARAKRSPRT